MGRPGVGEGSALCSGFAHEISRLLRGVFCSTASPLARPALLMSPQAISVPTIGQHQFFAW